MDDDKIIEQYKLSLQRTSKQDDEIPTFKEQERFRKLVDRALVGLIVASEIHREQVPEIFHEPTKRACEAVYSYSRELELIRPLDTAVFAAVELMLDTVRRHYKYQSAEFKCVADYDKCIMERGKSVACAMAFFICLTRRIIPLIK